LPHAAGDNDIYFLFSQPCWQDTRFVRRDEVFTSGDFLRLRIDGQSGESFAVAEV
jgi:hypothetical protein